jgi:hypothetical protein
MGWASQRTTGTPREYQLDKGGSQPVAGLPYVGIVKNTNDPIRAGRIQVWIKEFGNDNPADEDTWKTMSPVLPFYGTTEQFGTDTGEGSFVGNKQSYGMWWTAPDIDTQVVCIFGAGDPNQGYYIGSLVKPGINHMLPAIGSSRNYKLDNSPQSEYFRNATRLPVTEINDENPQIDGNPRFFAQPKPVHSVVAAEMLQQGLINDPVRGPIGSNAQRESPSQVFGMSTPGRPIYSGGLSEQDIRQRLESGAVLPQDAIIIARRGGHSIVMDDGDLTGQDQLIRIRTAKGHQITMSDSGDSFYIIHANGQTWMEFGSQGTVDVYATNSINFRSAGDINLHADRSVNINARALVNIRGERSVAIESNLISANADQAMLLYSDSFLGIKSDGSLSLKATKAGTWDGGSNMVLSAGCIALNSGDAPDVPEPSKITLQNLPDTTFEPNRGWVVQPGKIQTIATRVPTHEPYPFHGRGVTATADLQDTGEGQPFPREVDERFDSIQDTTFDAIALEQYEDQAPAAFSIGSISPEQVTGMLAQSSFNVDQDAFTLSDELGVGKYGFSPDQLEAAGYLKPGTVEFYLTDGTATASEILRSPNVWSGQAGVTNVAALLSDPRLQDAVQTDLYQLSLQGLRSQGIVTGDENPAKLAGIIQAGSKYGAETVRDWIKGTVQDETILTDLNKLGRSAQYAVQLVDQKVSSAIQGFSTVPPTSTNVTGRNLIDDAVSAVIGNPKVPSPDYGGRIRDARFDFYDNVADADLTYTGDDEIVLARINTERARRGLPPLGPGGTILT